MNITIPNDVYEALVRVAACAKQYKKIGGCFSQEMLFVALKNLENVIDRGILAEE